MSVAAVVAFAFVGLQSASAITASELMAAGFTQAQANLVVSLLGGSASTNASSCTTFGLPGVMGIQQAVNQLGYTPALVADGAFGPKTKAGVMWAQSVKLNVAADGAWGPQTNAAYLAWLANCSTGSDNGSDNNNNNNGDLDGDFGTIDSMSTISQYNNEEVGEGENEVKVVGFEVEASNDGDIMLNAIKLRFDPTGNTGSKRLNRYVDSVTVWMGDEEIGSADAEDFTKNSNDTYTKNLALDNAIVRANDTEKFYITVDAANAFDSADISGDSWTLAVDNVRYEDGSGVVTTDSSSVPSDLDWDSVGDGVAMNFVSFSTAADTELKISTHSDSPEAGIVIVDDNSSTDDVVLLKGKLKLEGSSDVMMDEFPVSFSPVGANMNEIVEGVRLIIDGEEYSESVPSIASGATGTVTFDDLDFDLGHGDTVTFEVVVDMTDMDGSVFAEGDSLEANVTSDNRAMIDAENEEGDQLTSSEKSGTAVGEEQEFRTEGISLTLVSTSAVASASDSDQTGTFRIKFKVMAVGTDVYVSSLAAASLTTSGTGFVAGVERSVTATVGGVSVVVANLTDTDLTAAGNYRIVEDDEETFEVTIAASLPTAGADGLFRGLLRAVDWNTTDDASTYTSYESNLDSFKTEYVSLQ